VTLSSTEERCIDEMHTCFNATPKEGVEWSHQSTKWPSNWSSTTLRLVWKGVIP